MRSRESIIQDNYEATIRALRQQLDSVSRLLAALCEHVEKTPQALMLITIADGKVAGWWGEHKKIEADRKTRIKAVEAERIANLRKEQEEKDIRDKILKKLTPEEIKILRVD